MKFKPHGKRKWQLTLDANDGGVINTYGGAVMYFAKRWAEAMEEALASAQSIGDCANDLSKEVNHAMGNLCLTGFQHGCAVSILSECWMHGESLRQWHNLKTQIRDEGERANESGGVLNPALICVG